MGSGDLGVVIVAAGSGTRFGNADKVFATLAGMPVVEHSVRLFSSVDQVGDIVLVLGVHTLDRGRELAAWYGGRVRVVLGGETRTESVRAGIGALHPRYALVAIHDAARPLISVALLHRLVHAAERSGAAVPVVPVTDTIYVSASDAILESVADRSLLRAVQTPQIARRDWLEHALSGATASTDEGSLLHAAGYQVTLVAGDLENIKITVPRDLDVAEAILAARRAVV